MLPYSKHLIEKAKKYSKICTNIIWFAWQQKCIYLDHIYIYMDYLSIIYYYIYFSMPVSKIWMSGWRLNLVFNLPCIFLIDGTAFNLSWLKCFKFKNILSVRNIRLSCKSAFYPCTYLFCFHNFWRDFVCLFTCRSRSSQGSATSIGRASFEMSATLISTMDSWNIICISIISTSLAIVRVATYI